MARSSSSALIGFAILNFSLEFYTLLCALERQKFLTLMFLEVRTLVRCFNLPLASTIFELNFKSRITVHFMDDLVILVHCVVRARLDTIPRREDNSRSVDLFCQL